ncbi:sensor histidine kinase [Ruminococcus flavefaciens]|uniref:sensor histidine kinase n=1 Tax=Ruminococcus flavefaciens TaxID=1265 RepID=UPI0004AE5085|nr:HAMP domain-containing sensor histidine kinase [Ruminococcus flavefaciens]
MIKRLRKRFILICTLSFLAVLVIMVTAIYVTNTVRQNRRLDFLADIISENGGTKHIVFISEKNHRFSSNEFMKLTVRIFGLGSLAVLALIIILSKFAMRPAAESYQKQKQFVTDANHELKTPLTLILTNIDIAEAELGQNEWLDDIRSEGERMSKLVNRLVALSRMDEEKAFGSFTEFDLSSAVSGAVSEFTELASMYGKNLTADIDKDIKYHGDESELRQLTAILLDNAVKSCDEGGSIKAVLNQKKHPTLMVTNSCKNVDNIKLDRFYREDIARTADSGFGIGLSIAQSITECHKGSIKAVKSADGVIGFIIVSDVYILFDPAYYRFFYSITHIISIYNSCLFCQHIFCEKGLMPFDFVLFTSEKIHFKILCTYSHERHNTRSSKFSEMSCLCILLICMQR